MNWERWLYALVVWLVAVLAVAVALVAAREPRPPSLATTATLLGVGGVLLVGAVALVDYFMGHPRVL